MIKYKRILLKLSGESLMGEKGHGIDENRLMIYANQIKNLSELGIKIGIVIGGGNIFRGLSGVNKGFDRVKGDYMGMLATVINSLALVSALESLAQKVCLLTSIKMSPVGEHISPHNMKNAFDKNEIVVFAGGTGNPYFTTDSASALRGIEMKADIFLKGTRVDGIYSDDPEKNPDAIKFENITFDETYRKGLKIMDLTAFTLCKENNLPILVFDMNTEGNLEKVVLGKNIGTLVHN